MHNRHTTNIRRLPYRSPKRPAKGVDTAADSNVAVKAQAADAKEVWKVTCNCESRGSTNVCWIATAVVASANTISVSLGADAPEGAIARRGPPEVRIVTGPCAIDLLPPVESVDIYCTESMTKFRYRSIRTNARTPTRTRRSLDDGREGGINVTGGPVCGRLRLTPIWVGTTVNHDDFPLINAPRRVHARPARTSMPTDLPRQPAHDFLRMARRLHWELGRSKVLPNRRADRLTVVGLM